MTASCRLRYRKSYIYQYDYGLAFFEKRKESIHMKYLAGSTLQKVIAAIIAAFMSFSVITPAISKPKTNQKPVGIVQTVKKVDGQIVAVEPEKSAPVEEETTAPEETAPEAEAEAEETAAPEETTAPAAEAEEAAAPVVETEETAAPADETEEAAAPEAQAEETPDSEAYEAVAEWDISDTEKDDVHMYYYTDDSFLDTVAGAVRALFVPMTAYAAEDETYNGGTLYIDGEGSTESLVFLNLIKDSKAFLRGYEEWAIDNGYIEDELFYHKDSLDAKGYVNCEDMMSAAEARNLSKVDGKVNYNNMLANYYPTYLMDMVLDVENFWALYGFITPEKVIIDGNIESISFGAFAFCSSIKELEIRGTVNSFETGAFAGTNLQKVTIPEGTKNIGSSAFTQCNRLAEVHLPSTVESIGEYSFSDMSANSVIYCASDTVVFLLVDKDDLVSTASADGTVEETYGNFDASKTEILIG